MSEENNSDSVNISISEDAFDQFQASSQCEEEEFITLSDIVSPDPVQLPKDISEIPYDNEVVLSNSDEIQPGSTETSEIDRVVYDDQRDVIQANQSEVIDSTQSLENNLELPPQETADENESGLAARPRRARKQKNYAEDFQPMINFKTEGKKKSVHNTNSPSSEPIAKSKRGRKPKRSLEAQNDSTQPEASLCDTPTQQTPVAPKKGRKRVSNKIHPNLVSQTSSTVQHSVRKRGRRPKVTPVEGDMPSEEQLNNLPSAEQLHEVANEEQLTGIQTHAGNNVSSEEINNSGLDASASVEVSKKGSGRRGRKRKSQPEHTPPLRLSPNLPENVPPQILPENAPPQILPENAPPQTVQTGDVSNSSLTEVNSTNRLKKKRRKRTAHRNNNVTTKFDDQTIESDDELDNLSLQALCQRNIEEQVSTTENIPSSEQDIDVGYDEFGKVQEYMDECVNEVEVNTEPQDMELDEPVDSSHNLSLNEDLPVKVEVTETVENGNIKESATDSLLVEDSSKRPRRRAKKIFKYEEESDEDPFANVELSDDEPSGKRKTKYHDDDEYVPELETSKKGGRHRKPITESEDSDISEIDEDLEHLGKKRKRGANRTPQKRGRKDTTMSHGSLKDASDDLNLLKDINVTTIPPSIDLVNDPDDIEVCLQSSVIHANKEKVNGESTNSNTWGGTNAFESFIAQKIQGTSIKIKKVSSKEPSQNTPLEIPVLVPEAKKLVEKEVQTNTAKLSTVGVQTSAKHEAPMKNNVTLTAEQSQQACEFLKSIVKTTSELGQLMTQKSEDFITKKIHTDHVTDTLKMDYCVRKSFLLLKLAKHNIVQMEEDLSKQYDEFLKKTELLHHREEEKTITATEKDNDSDCEIVEGPSHSSKSDKSKFNPKTVFLNKELSIKIAKKPQQSPVEKKCKQLGLNKHSVWINDSVMVKKVKPTQSFLAQDSRNKKPPDCFVTEKMVSDFFKDYYHKFAPVICAPFTSTEWLGMGSNYVCSYFFVKSDKFTGASGSFPDNEEICLDGSASSNSENTVVLSDLKTANDVQKTNPGSLLSLCTESLRKHMNMVSFEETSVKHPCTLFRLCVNALKINYKSCIKHDFDSNHYNHDQNKTEVIQPKTLLCNQKINETNHLLKCDDENYTTQQILAQLNVSSNNNVLNESTDNDLFEHRDNVTSLKTLCYKKLFALPIFTETHTSTAETHNCSEDYITSKLDSLTNISVINCNNNSETQDDNFELIVPRLATLCHSNICKLFSLQEATMSSHDYISDVSSILSDKQDYMMDDDVCFKNALTELHSLVKTKDVSSLFSICISTMQELLQMTKYVESPNVVSNKNINVSALDKLEIKTKFAPDSLKCMSLEVLKDHMFSNIDQNKNIAMKPLSTRKVKKLADLCFAIVSAVTAVNSEYRDSAEVTGMTINSVNTVSEDVFHNMEGDNENEEDNDTTLYEEDDFGDSYENLDEENHEDDQNEENNWVSQLKLQVQQDMKNFVTLNNRVNNEAEVTDDSSSHMEDTSMLEPPLRVKQEPLEESPETVVDSTCVKAEPLHNDEICDLPDNVIPKMEPNPLERQSTSTFDVDSFENFVRQNKIMNSLGQNDNMNDIMDQMGRVRRQHEPDYMNEYDPSLNLLVPQTFEPISVINAKGVLMESSSDEEGKKSGQKKGDKRTRGRPKKGTGKQQKPQPEKAPAVKEKSTPEKPSTAKEKSTPEKPPTAKEKSTPEKPPTAKEKSTAEKPPTAKEKLPLPPAPNEVAVLTRRMREKIRQEEKKVQSSDSESESVPLTRRKDKDRKEKDNEKSKKSLNEEPVPIVEKRKEIGSENIKTIKNQKSKPPDDEIQCNNVDSTEQIENMNDSPDNTQKFSGFSAVDQNEITSYQKYVKFVYDKILPKDTPSPSPTNEKAELTANEPANDSRAESPLIDYDEPAEMLECEPTMPIFDEEHEQKKSKIPKVKSKFVKDKSKVNNKKSEEIQIEMCKDDDKSPMYKEEMHKDENKSPIYKEEMLKDENKSPIYKEEIHKDKNKSPIYKERDGWHCYPIDPNETKLYQSPALILDKLPEDFVDIYFRYQEISDTQKEDEEVNRLINLNTLNRPAIKEGKKSKLKVKLPGNEPQPGKPNTSRSASPYNDERAELTASEDEGANVDDEIPPAMPLKSSENHLAKDSLMNESDSDDVLSKIKQEQEQIEDEVYEKPKPACKKKFRKGVKVEEPKAPDNLMLTADKMMNKELNLLHAPVVLSNELDKSDKGPSPKNKHRSGSKKNSSQDHSKNEEDSSSEEEKQWVNTKEKLLKRMVKKDAIIADETKRAKLVCDFIERREGMECRKRTSGKKRRRNSRKILEREKQMRVLQHELLGVPLDPAVPGSKHTAHSVFKGRRNIRKVIDKKSLARSTVIANMEEFERKRRLSNKQARLRELLGCEEDVNVLVINDEVCLEYGFEEQRPLVTIHPFFTKVMKAHQYEGVKFMWDACFESLEQIESGHPGGGCILAHCMGLGKTLQVLALLHTVLTHPRVGMQRVLVCCPLSTVLNWVDEIHKWIGPVTDQIKVFELSKLKKTYERAYQLEDWYSGGGIFIIGYELFRSLTTLDPEFDDIRPTIVNKIRTALLDPGPDIVVCDEGHLLKNDCSVLAVAMSRVATKRRIVLTGTPMQNNLREYYCMVNFIKPNLLGTYSEYSNRFENPIMNGQHRDSQEEDIKLMKQRTHILHKVLEGCLQRQEASVLYPYLPKKHEYTVFISLTQVQWDMYKHYLDNYAQKANKHSVLKDFHILQKIWSHPQVLHNFHMKRRDETNKIKAEKLEDDLAREDLTATEDVKPLETNDVWWLQYQQSKEGENMLECLASSNKFVVVFKILDECIALGDKVLIFSTSLFTMDSLEYFLKTINKWSLGQEYYRLDGSVPPEVRQKWCREFNAEHNLKTKLFLISTRAGSLGLNMVAANRVIILDTSWNPAHDIQSIFRVYRFGQKKDCYIYRLVALGTMEQKIYERSVTKQAVACRVVDEQQIDRHYNMAELTELYKYDEEGITVASGVAVGVEDVALLRVARHPALHAVHEHDSLLRGSSEQQLPEHERAAAWMQFQQEHAHKQMQNHLTSSFSLHLPLPGMMPNGMMVNIPNLQMPGISQPEVKQEKTDDPEFQPTPEQKGKKGRKKTKDKDTENLSNQTPPPSIPEYYHPYQSLDSPDIETKGTKGKKTKGQENDAQREARALEENMVQEIMSLLLKHNFQDRQGPKEIAELVATVRKMVAYGKPPKAHSKLAKSIADVLLAKEGVFIAAAEDDPMRKTIQKAVRKKRGRPRKDAASDNSEPTTPQPSNPQLEFDTAAFPGRRRAAINAEKQIDSITSDQDWQDDADWQGDEGAGDEFIPETRPTKKSPIKQEKIDSVVAAPPTQPTQVDESIVLSDDDEPTPKQYKNKKAEPKKPPPKEDEPVPLHPSLLSNKNFIKIVAHTYLEGNPMLDEDAATLAAQYSTLKAKKELETSGKPIVNGPIYDIAIKVLGIDILKKLNKTNPVKPVVPKPPPIKKEPGASTAEPAPEPEAVTKPTSEPEPEQSQPSVKPEPKEPEVEKRRPGPRLKARKLRELTESVPPASAAPAPAPVPATLPTASPYVVPIGLINRTRPVVPPPEPVPAPYPAVEEPFEPPQAEESILPDDDDVIASDEPSVPPKSVIRKNAKPLVLNSVIAATNSAPSQGRSPIPKLVISAGKLMPLSKMTVSQPAQNPPEPVAPPSNDTIFCLDSDEEEPPPVAPQVKKRPVAIKSTAKPPYPKTSAPVPVSITTSNPQLSAALGQPTIPPPAMYGQQLPPNPKYVVIPASNMVKLPPGVRPAMHNLQPLPQSFVPPNIMPNPVPTAIHTSIGYMQPIYQEDLPVMSQNVNYSGPVPTMMIASSMAPTMSAVPQPQPIAPKPIPQPTTIQQPTLYPMPSAPPKPAPTKPPNKTVCKPGDILRITASGQVEILNREDDDSNKKDAPAIPETPEIPQPTERLKRLRERLSKIAGKGSPPPTPTPKSTPPPKPATPTPAKQAEPPTKISDRIRTISSSSSSSEDSRPPTPDDPLSILKDVVRIEAPEDAIKKKPAPASKKQEPSKLSKQEPSKPSTMVGSTSIASKSSVKPSLLGKSGPSSAAAAKKFLGGTVKKPSTPQKTPDQVMKHISNTSTILKKLDKALASSPSKTIDTIDLDAYEQPASSSKKEAPKKDTAKKVVGTGKDIIISMTGRSPGLSTAAGASKNIRVTNVEKIAAPTAKRPAPQPPPPPQKKKKTEMSLQDFNIDDIDDIIELD